MRELTDKQQRVLDYVVETLRRTGAAPTVREIADAVGVKSSCTVQTHLNALEKKGYISRDRYRYRSIQVASASLPAFTRAVYVPILGEITAGVPMLAQQNIEASYPLPIDLVRDGDEVFMLKVRGDSMINAGIFDGDLVAIRRQPAARNGEIVAALLEDEATIKRFYKDGSAIRLVAENPDYEPIVTRDCTILGKVILSIRQFN